MHVATKKAPFRRGFLFGGSSRSRPSRMTSVTYKPAYLDDFVCSRDGLRLAQAYRRVAMRSPSVALVNENAGGDRRTAP